VGKKIYLNDIPCSELKQWVPAEVPKGERGKSFKRWRESFKQRGEGGIPGKKRGGPVSPSGDGPHKRIDRPETKQTNMNSLKRKAGVRHKRKEKQTSLEPPRLNGT